MDDKDPHIRSQNSAHRRGLVLGLTMAEIMVLILFTLLLALSAALSAKTQRIAQLTVFEQRWGELLRNSPNGVTVEDVIQRLERQESKIAELQHEVDRLKPYEESGRALEDIIHEIKRGGDDNVTPQQIVKKLTQILQLNKDNDYLRKDNDNLRGQVAQLSSQIKGAGRGNEFPSCWVTPDGKTESIFELLVTASGIKIKDHYLADRLDDKAALPLSAVRYDSEIPLGEFQSELRPLYQWSVNQHCRFYVIIFSSVTSAPIQLINAVNAYFYPDSSIQYRPTAL